MYSSHNIRKVATLYILWGQNILHMETFAFSMLYNAVISRKEGTPLIFLDVFGNAVQWGVPSFLGKSKVGHVKCIKPWWTPELSLLRKNLRVTLQNWQASKQDKSCKALYTQAENSIRQLDGPNDNLSVNTNIL